MDNEHNNLMETGSVPNVCLNCGCANFPESDFCANCGAELPVVSECGALRKAFRMMNLDPAKVAAIVTENGDNEFKAILFGCVSLDKEKLASRAGRTINLMGLMDCWQTLEIR